VLYEVHNLRAAKKSHEVPAFRGIHVGVAVDCENGSVLIINGGTAVDNKGKTIKTFPNGGDHFVNFVDAVRSGRREKLNAEILEGHRSTSICNAGNISYRLGKKASAAEIRRQIGDLPEFAAMFERYLKHLEAHEIDPGESILGPLLECDREHECFVDNAAANALVHGFYRAPYTLPDLKG
jgi:hypothetical protein